KEASLICDKSCKTVSIKTLMFLNLLLSLWGFTLIYPAAKEGLTPPSIALYPDTVVMLSISSYFCNKLSVFLNMSVVRDREATGGMDKEYVKKLSSSVGIKLFGVNVSKIKPMAVMATKIPPARIFLEIKYLDTEIYLFVNFSNEALNALKNLLWNLENFVFFLSFSFSSSGLFNSKAHNAGLNVNAFKNFRFFLIFFFFSFRNFNNKVQKGRIKGKAFKTNN